ncbi:DUF6527 family protein [Acetobacter fabarum]|uniref:DUF6527 family protein n=1 Tax=Acetobacter fabarum TaxID=483199 RepID=UPI00344147E7
MMGIKILSPVLGMITCADVTRHFTFCPACDTIHLVNLEGSPQTGPKWRFSGSEQSPTFSPSVRVDWGDPSRRQCHYFVRDGKTQFCSDSTHELAGKIVPLPEIPDEWKEQ